MQPNIQFQPHKFLIIIMFILYIQPTKSFYTQLIPQQQNKCYLLTTFPNENILVQIKLPTITDNIKIQLECFIGEQRIFTKQLKKLQDKITIRLTDVGMAGKINQAQTCIKTTILIQSQQQKQQIRNKKYLIWFTQHSNFIKHISQKTSQIKSKSTSDILNEITSKILNMNQTYTQQINRFQNHQEKDNKNQQILYQIVQEMYVVSIVEGFVIFGTLTVYVFIIYRFYLRY